MQSYGGHLGNACLNGMVSNMKVCCTGVGTEDKGAEGWGIGRKRGRQDGGGGGRVDVGGY